MTDNPPSANDAAAATGERVRQWEESQRADIATARGAFEACEGRIRAAAAWYASAAATAPHDPTPLPFLAAAFRALGDGTETAIWERLTEVSPSTSSLALSTITQVDEFLARDHVDAQSIDSADLIVVLGYQLTDDGRPRDRLIRRLRTALDLARRMPDALLLLSGGAVGGTPRSEASVMAKYLRSAGIPAHRILTERHSQDTLENIEFAHQFVQDEGATSIILVSEDPHLTRAAALLGLTGWFTRVGQGGDPVRHPFTTSERFATYRDALRLRGFRHPTTRSPAMEQEFDVRRAMRGPHTW